MTLTGATWGTQGPNQAFCPPKLLHIILQLEPSFLSRIARAAINVFLYRGGTPKITAKTIFFVLPAMNPGVVQKSLLWAQNVRTSVIFATIHHMLQTMSCGALYGVPREMGRNPHFVLVRRQNIFFKIKYKISGTKTLQKIIESNHKLILRGGYGTGVIEK